MVAARHRADLGDRLVAFIDEQQRVVGQVFEQGRRRFAGHAPGQEARIVFDSRARAGGGHHFEVEVRALLQPLGFEQLALGVEFLQPLGQLELDRLARLHQRRAGGDVV